MILPIPNSWWVSWLYFRLQGFLIEWSKVSGSVLDQCWYCNLSLIPGAFRCKPLSTIHELTHQPLIRPPWKLWKFLSTRMNRPQNLYKGRWNVLRIPSKIRSRDSTIMMAFKIGDSRKSESLGLPSTGSDSFTTFTSFTSNYLLTLNWAVLQQTAVRIQVVGCTIIRIKVSCFRDMLYTSCWIQNVLHHQGLRLGNCIVE